MNGFVGEHGGVRLFGKGTGKLPGWVSMRVFEATRLGGEGLGASSNV